MRVNEKNYNIAMCIGSAVTAFALVILGMILLFDPSFSDRLCVSLGVILVALSMAEIALCAYETAIRGRRIVVFFSVLLCVLGLWLVSEPEIICRILPVPYGLIVLEHGLVDLYLSSRLRKLGLPHQTYAAAGACVLALSVSIFFNPFDASRLMARLAGMVFLLSGVVLLYLLLQFFRQEKKKHRE